MRTEYLFRGSVFLVATFLVNTTSANPLGGSVVGGRGNATIAGEGTASVTIHQTANRAIINWQDFSIGAGEVTRFIQPSATASALNRVLGGNATEIYGSLQANGRVSVINRNGILVGPGGQVDTKGFLASTLDVPNASFLAGANLTLSGDSTASVRNQGTIRALGGDVFLIGHTVENAGTISAPSGTVGLAAGSQVRLVQAGSERISVLAGKSGAAADKGVNNLGTVEAATAELKAAGGNIYALAINNGGVVRANKLVNEGGKLFLRASGGNIQNSGTLAAKNADGSGGTVIVDGGHNATAPATVISSGTIEARGDAAGTKGGEVQVLGDRVGLTGNALVDVSGDAGGGSIRIGGDFHGNNPSVPNARQTTVEQGAMIRADSVTGGDAGNVVVWADDTTVFEGTINARALGDTGAGGVAEISGAQNLSISGHAYLSGAHGSGGSLLLDPGSVTIDDGPNNTTGQNNIFHDDWIINQLNTGGADLTISTANASGGGSEDLIVNGTADTDGAANISWNSIRSLTLIGNNSIALHAGSVIDNNSSGALIIQSGGQVSLEGTVSMTGNLNLTSGNNITDGSSGSLVVGGTTTIAAGAGAANSVTLDNTGHNFGTVVITSGNDVMLNEVNNISLNGVNLSGDLSVSAAEGIIIAGNITAASVTAHSGTDGTGNLSFGAAGLTVRANSQSYRAGNGIGGNTGASANLTGNDPNFRDTVGNAAPMTFAYRQDGVIDDMDIPDVARFGGIAPATYTIQSDEGNLTLTTPEKVAGSALTLLASLAAGTLTLGGSTPAELWTLSSLDAQSAGSILFNGDVTASSVSAHSGTDGTGNITFADLADPAVVDIHANIQSYRAGNGIGGNTSASANLTGSDPNFRNTAGNAAPMTFTYRQDATIADAALPAVDRFGGTAPGTYNIQSDEGGVTLSTGAKVVNSILTLSAANALAINGSLTLASLVARAGTDGSDNLTVGAGVTVSANSQSYQAGDGRAGAGTGAAANLTGNNPTFRNTAGDAAPGTFLYRQDDDIAAMDIPSIAPTTSYVIQSDDGGVVLPALTMLGTLSVMARETINDNGMLAVTGDASFITQNSSPQNITLDQALSTFGTVTARTLNDEGAAAVAGTINIFEGGDLDLKLVETAGNATFTATGDITDSGTLTVGGDADFITRNTVAPKSITLDQGASMFGTVTARTLNDAGGAPVAGTINIFEAGDLDLKQVDTMGNAIFTATGNITDSGTLTVVGDASFITRNTAAPKSITLDQGASMFGTVTARTLNDAGGAPVAGTINIFESGDLDLKLVDTTGNATFTATGNITDSGTLTVVGDASFITRNTAAPKSITLDQGASAFGTVTARTLNDAGGAPVAGTISIFESGDLDLKLVDTTGNATFTATGNITDSGTLTVVGDASFITRNTAAPKSITLDQGASAFGTVAARTLNDAGGTPVAGTINIFEAGDLDLKLVDTTGNATFTATGNITDSGTLTVGGDASFITRNTAAPKSITLDQGASAFGTVTARTLNDAGAAAVAGTINIFEGGDLDLKLVNTTGNATFTATGNITDSGTLTVGGDASFITRNTAAPKSITLDQGASMFGTVTARTLQDAGPTAVAGEIDIFESGDLDLKLVDTTGNATFTATGDITDSGTLMVGGDASFITRNTAAPKSITLDQGASMFGTVTARTLNDAGGAPVAGTINIFESGDLDFKLVNTTGNATFTATGTITDSGTLTVGGDASFITRNTAAPKSITLDQGASMFGTVTARTLNDAGGAPVTGTIDIFESGDLDLKLVDTTGNATFTATGNITDSGTLTVGGDASFITRNTVAPKSITLDQGASAFGTVTARTLNDAGGALVAGTINIFESGDLDLKLVDTMGNGTFTATGNITDSGTLTVVGDASFITRNTAAPKSITLDQGASAFGTVTARTLNDAGGAPVAGTINIFEGGDLDLKQVDTMGNATFAATGNITDSGTLMVGGDASFITRNTVAPKSITLDQGASAFGTVTARTLNDAGGAPVAGTIDIFESGDLDLKLVDTTGKATFTATGNITDSGTLMVGGDASFITRNTAAPKSITLDQGVSAFGTVTARTLNDAGAAAVAGTINIFEGGDLDLKLVDTTGNGTFTATGNLTDSGELNVGGLASFVSTGVGISGNITLDFAGHDFGSLGLSSANGAAVVVSEASATELDTVAVNAGTLAVASGGAITQVGGRTIIAGDAADDVATFTAPMGNSITLDNDGNTFNGTVSFVGNGGNLLNVTVRDTTAFDLQTLFVDGTLRVTSGAEITDSGELNVVGLASFTATGVGVNGNIVLDFPGHDFGSLGLNSANGAAVTVLEASATALDNVAVNNGALIINSAGAISQVASRTLTVGGLASFTSTGIGADGDITLDNAGNNLGSLGLNSANGLAVSATEASATALDNVAVNSGALTINSVGAISQVADRTLTVGGLASFTSTGAGANGNIELNNTANNFGSLGLATANGEEVRVSEASETALDNVAVDNGALTINSVGAISQVADRTLTVGGLALFTSTGVGANGNIELNNTANNFGSLGLATANGEAVRVSEASETALETVAVDNGALTINSAGAISQVPVRTLMVGGLASFTSTGGGADGNITLNNDGNNFGSLGLVSANGSMVSATETSATELDTVAANAGTLAVTSGGDITQVGGQTITAGNAATFTAPMGDSITLGNAGNTFNGAVNFVGPGGNLLNVTILDSDPFGFDIAPISLDSLNGTLSVNSGGPITQSGAITAASLNVTAVGPVVLDGENQIGEIEGSVTGSGDFSFSDKIPLSVVGTGIKTANGKVTLKADEMNIVANITAGMDGRAVLVPSSMNRGIELGGEVSDRLSLTDGELGQVTAGVLQIGNETTGNINVSGEISPALTTTMTLRTGATITEDVNLGRIIVANMCIHTIDGQASKFEATLGGQNDWDRLAADGGQINVFDIDELLVDQPVDDCPPSVPVGSKVTDFKGTKIIQAAANALSALLSAVDIPVPKTDTASFGSSGMSAEDAAKILPSGSIGTLWLQVVPLGESEEPGRYKLEDASKWVGGRVAAMGSTAGPQTPR